MKQDNIPILEKQLYLLLSYAEDKEERFLHC